MILVYKFHIHKTLNECSKLGDRDFLWGLLGAGLGERHRKYTILQLGFDIFFLSKFYQQQVSRLRLMQTELTFTP
jgi:hypothetical protein